MMHTGLCLLIQLFVQRSGAVPEPDTYIHVHVPPDPGTVQNTGGYSFNQESLQLSGSDYGGSLVRPTELLRSTEASVEQPSNEDEDADVGSGEMGVNSLFGSSEKKSRKKKKRSRKKKRRSRKKKRSKKKKRRRIRRTTSRPDDPVFDPCGDPMYRG